MGARRALIFVSFTAFAAAPALAQVTEIYKCIEPSGRPLYTSDKRETKGRKCVLVSREVSVVPASKTAAARPNGFPKETASERTSARDRQRDILQKELATEEQDLAKAKQELSEQQTIRTGDERNYAKALERLQRYKDAIETHEKNIEALRRELANTRR